MQDDCIVVALGLPQLKILWQQELEGHIEVTVIYRREEATCPRCGKVTHKEHDRRMGWVIVVMSSPSAQQLVLFKKV